MGIIQARTRSARIRAVVMAVIAFTALGALAPRTFAEGRVLTHEAVIDASPAELWEAWTTDEGIRSWMVPHGKVDFRVGGAYRTSYQANVDLDGEQAIVNRILAYEPERMIAIQNVQTPPGFPNPEIFQQTWSVVRFEPVGRDRTRMVMNGYGYGEGEQWDQIYAMFEQGNAYILQVLKQKFAKENAETAARDYSPEGVLAALEPMVGGCWRGEQEQPDGSTLRSVFIVKSMNGGSHLMAHGWIGDEQSMHPHGLSVIGLNPAIGSAWYWEFLEGGIEMDGPAWVEGDGVVHMDLTMRSPNGDARPMHATYRFADDDHMTWSMLNDDGTPFIELAFERAELDELGEWVDAADARTMDDTRSDGMDSGIEPERFANEPTDRAIVVEREVDAPVADVWRIWTTNEGFHEAYGKETDIQLRVGGPFEIYWDAANRIGSNGCHVLSFSPHRHLAFSWNAPPSIPTIRERRTIVTVTFEPLGKNRTKMRIVNDGYGKGADWDEAFAYFEAAWPSVADRIAMHFEKG